MTPQERIKADAEAYANGIGDVYRKYAARYGYIAGATAEHDRAQVLVDALEGLLQWHTQPNKIPAEGLDRRVEAARNALEQWEGKEKKQADQIEYMPILSAELRELKDIPHVPVRVPMHLLSPEQAECNHGQTLQRLKDRGGLGIKEAIALITRQSYMRYREMDIKNAVMMLNDIIDNNPQQSK